MLDLVYLGTLTDVFFKVEQKLQSQRRQWLRSESLHKGLQEMIQEHCIRKHHATVPPDQNMVHFSYLYAQTADSKLRTTYIAYAAPNGS